jgi:hypothetical protein
LLIVRWHRRKFLTEIERVQIIQLDEGSIFFFTRTGSKPICHHPFFKTHAKQSIINMSSSSTTTTMSTMIENENGSISYSSSNSARLDLFFKTVRGIDSSELIRLIENAWKEDPLHTLKIIFYCRDCRGGKGERSIFYEASKWLIKNHKDTFIKNIKLIPERFGRWSDLLEFMSCEDESVSEAIASLFANQLKQDVDMMNEGKPITLCAKWAPTERLSQDKKTKSVKKICKPLGVDKKTYRKEYLVPLRAYAKVIECYMSSKQWELIDYSHVPGVAMNRLKKAFAKNDPVRFEEYQNKLKSGDKSVKVNATTLDPHTLVSQYMYNKVTGVDTIIEEQWKEIVKRVETLGGMRHALVLSDVSGSMQGTPMEVSIAMGLLISELSLPPFRNLVLTFETDPKLHHVTGESLRERVSNLQDAPWGGSTNFQAAFDLILSRAQQHSLAPEDMPTQLYIISDMQFDVADRNARTHLQLIRDKFAQAGYEMPQIIFWNVRANTKDFPATTDDDGIAMIAGYSASLLKSVIDGEKFDPFSIVLKTITDKRYEDIEL